MNQQDVRITKLHRRKEPPIESSADIKSRKARAQRYFIPVKGQHGLRLKVETSGTKVFVTQAKDPAGKTRSETIGKYPEYKLEDARKLHAEYFKAIREGKDLNLERERKTQATQRLTWVLPRFNGHN